MRTSPGVGSILALLVLASSVEVVSPVKAILFDLL
jgi:hypothetical protein